MKQLPFGEQFCTRARIAGSASVRNAPKHKQTMLIGAALLVCAAVLLASCKPSLSPETKRSLLLAMIGQGDVVYHAGNLPVIITVPHGGTAAPDDIPDRVSECGTIINTNDDVNTIDLALDIVEALLNISGGKSPYVIINTLSRQKIDQNRGFGEDCNPVSGRGGRAWLDFHDRFTGEIAIGAVLERFGAGLYIDLHGKPDNYGETIMVGYNLSATALSETDGILNDPVNGYAEKSTLRFLSVAAGPGIDFAGLLRGNVSGHESFGSLLQEGIDELNASYARDYTVAPGAAIPSPNLLFYMGGGYNVQAFCGVTDSDFDNQYGYTASRFISGFQLEVCREIRDSEPLRRDFARKVAEAIQDYLDRHYDIQI